MNWNAEIEKNYYKWLKIAKKYTTDDEANDVLNEVCLYLLEKQPDVQSISSYIKKALYLMAHSTGSAWNRKNERYFIETIDKEDFFELIIDDYENKNWHNELQEMIDNLNINPTDYPLFNQHIFDGEKISKLACKSKQDYMPMYRRFEYYKEQLIKNKMN